MIPLISIIVPIYNAEKYLEACISSVCNQSFENYELILVNDGSLDGSLEICMKWKYNPHVRVISTDNFGVSHARNIGMENAKGEWIMFLDSDDYLLDNSLNNLVKYIGTGVEEVSAVYLDQYKNIVNHKSEVVCSKNVMIMSLDPFNYDLLPAFYELKAATLLSCCGKLFLKKIIEKNNIRFQENISLSEDLIFHLDYLSCIKKVIIVNIPVFYYRCNFESATKRFKEKYLKDRFLLAKILDKYTLDMSNVHIVSTLMLMICQIEKYTCGTMRRELEKEVCDFFEENSELLELVKNKKLSNGKWQKIFYKISAWLFRKKKNKAAFNLLKYYGVIAKGDI